MTIKRTVWPLLCVLFGASQYRADDWPQFLGPQRDGVSQEKGLLPSWPKEGPRQIWRRNVGAGYSGPVVAGTQLIVFHRIGDEEVIECLNATDGKASWKKSYATQFE